MSYATQTLAHGLQASLLASGPAFTKLVVDAASLSASIPAVLAHAGKVRVAAGADPVDTACLAMWGSIRADISVVARGAVEVAKASNRVQALRDLAPLWVDDPPEWVPRRSALPSRPHEK